MKHNYLKHLFTALLLLCTTVVSAYDFEVDGICYNITDATNKTVEVARSNYTGSITIPVQVTNNNVTYTVTSIRSLAFYNCSGLTSVEIPNSVTAIQDQAFEYCTNLQSVTIPSSVKSIGYRSFENCLSLQTVNLSEGLTSIGVCAFQYCVKLNEIIIPSSVTNVSNYAFRDCSTLESVTFCAKTAPTPTNAVFDGISSNAVLRYPAGSDYSGWSSYFASTEEFSATIGGSCGTNVNWSLADGVLTIAGNGAMYDYYAWGTPAPWVEYATLITNVVIEDGVTTIGEYAFDGCGGLTSVEIPNSIIKIGESAFSNCPALTSVVIPSGVEVFGYIAFYGCTGLRKVINLSATSLSHTFLFADTNKTCTIYNCPNGEIVGDYIFCKTDGVKTLYKYIGNGGEIVLPDNYKGENYVIGDEAFLYCRNLTAVTISNGVTSIGELAFFGCTALAKVEIPNSVTRIELWAFYGCDNLTEVEIPNSVTVLESGVFAYCENLVNVVIPNTVTSIGVLNSGMLEGPFEGCTSLSEVEIPNSVTVIGECAFNHCTALENIEIPSSVTRIGGAAFNNCTSLTSIVIGNSVTSIGNYAFEGCTGLKSIEIPNSVTSIGGGAFSGCIGLTSITSLIPADALFAVYSYTFNNVDKNTCTLYVPYGAKETYASTAGWNEFTNIVELDPSEITITINQYGCATFCSEFTLDFSNVEGLKAYAATGYKTNSQVVTLTRVQTAEAGIGLFLKGEPGEYIVPVIESTDEHSLNMLVGTLEPTIVNCTDGAMSNYKFTILPGDETPMFYPFEDGTTLSAGKAYLQIPTAWLPATAHKSLSVRFDDGETTDIDEVSEEVKEQRAKSKDVYYDLSGRVVENPTSGIYIIDGKKVIIK